MADQEITIRATTIATVSAHRLGVSNIWVRELLNDQGARTSRLSAQVFVLDTASQQERHETVVVGSVLSLGPDRYCVVKLEEDKSSPGSLTLRKIAQNNDPAGDRLAQ